MNKITLQLLYPDQDRVLAGRLEGKRTLGRLLESTPNITIPTVIFLNFRDVELATSSYLSEAVLAFRDHLRLRRVPAYPVAANVTAKVREELDDLLRRTGDALLICDVSMNGEVSNSTLLGILDPKLNETFELVKKKSEASATELHAESDDTDNVGPTAWNNRLSALAAKGLLMEIPTGRAKKYRPVLEGA